MSAGSVEARRGLSPLDLAGGALLHAIALALVLLTLVLVGQPLYANDTWIHLALGEVFASEGPWLTADPHLYAAPGPPAPSSWLGSVAIHGVQSMFGFAGLRFFHALFVGMTLGLAWWVARRASGSARGASVSVVLFIVLATYRLVQLRPELFTIAATLLVVTLLVVRPRPPGAAEIAGVALLSALWANVHAGFLLGPLLILGVSASLFALPLLPGVRVDPGDRHRAKRLGVAGAAMLVGSFANPMGWEAHAAYFVSGDATLELTAVVDEWARTNLLAWPVPRGLPTWAGWSVAWGCLFALGLGAARGFAELRAGVGPEERSVDPALVALAFAGVVAGLLASRFLWLAFFAAILGVVCVTRPSPNGGSPLRTPAAASVGRWVAVLLVAFVGWLHLAMGDWVLVSRALSSAGGDYRAPYYAAKFQGHAVWFLADSEVEGRIYNAYPLGGFMSAWLSPRISMSSSGTMNVERETIEANLAIANGAALGEGEDLTTVLDRQGVDLFLGTGLPVEAIPGRQGPSTVHHLEGQAGWVPIFRSLRSAVYLRRNEKNANNLAKVADYYAQQGVPFDPAVGFDPERVITRATEWAIDHALIPVDFEGFIRDLRDAGRNRAAVAPSMHRLATLYATLGLYERALGVDRLLLRESRDDLAASYRRVWCLLRSGRLEEAYERALEFDQVSGVAADETVGLAANVREVIEASPDDRRRLLSFLPLYTSDQAAIAQFGMVAPEARANRPARSESAGL